MKARRRILLYGNSVIIGSIRASLQRFSQLEVTTITPPLQEVQDLDAVDPDILLFDLETIRTESLFSLLKSHPNLLLIGVSPDINAVHVWSGRQLRDLSMQGLLEVINEELKDLAVKSSIAGNHP